jgi:uncharacterized iron-regulated membrane protein
MITQEETYVPTQSHKSGWLRALILRIHFYAGILVGPFIFVAAVSGAAYAIMPQVENVVYKHELFVPASSATHALAEQIAAAQQVVPDVAVSAVRPAPTPGTTTRVMFAQPGLGDSESRTIFIDPATLEVRGDLTTYGTSGSLPLRTWVDNLHRNLHLGDMGRLYSELAASWLWALALGGVWLWFTRRKKSTRIRKTHGVIGMWIAVVMVFLSATGLTWSQFAGDNVSNLRSQLSWATPSVSTKLGSTTVNPAASPALFDSVWQTAKTAGIAASRVEIKPSATKAWTVTEIGRSWPTEVDAAAVDPTTLTVTDKVEFAKFPLAAKLSRWGIDLHMGVLFGLPNQILMFIVAILIAVLVVFGYMMWWQRRPRFTPRTVGMPWPALVAGFAAAVGLGLFLPLFGISLAIFLIGDFGYKFGHKLNSSL